MKAKTKKEKAAPQADVATTATKQLPPIKRNRIDVALEDIVPAPWNPRGEISDASVADLVASIRTVGIIEPIVVMPANETGKAIIIAGHRRVAAAKIAGLATVPADLLIGIDTAAAKRMTFIENLQRKDADPLLESNLVAELVADGMTTDEIAAEIGRDRKWVLRRKNLANLSPSWRKRVADGEKIAIDCLEHIAAYPIALQEKCKKESANEYDRGDGGILCWSNIKRAFFYESRHLSDACFDCTNCLTCAKNTGSQPDLFDWHSKPVALGDCTDAKCYQKKTDAHIREVVADAKAKSVEVIEGRPDYDVHTSDRKTKKCCALYVYREAYQTQSTIRWGEPPKKSRGKSGVPGITPAEAAKRKETRERNKAIKQLAAWCAGGTAGEPCNLAKLLAVYYSEEDLHEGYNTFAPFVAQHAFALHNWPNYGLIGTRTNIQNAAVAATFGNLIAPREWINVLAAQIILALDPTKCDGYPANHNANMIVHMFDSQASASEAIGAEAVGAILGKEEFGNFRNQPIAWINQTTTANNQ